jgi:hypothetical protein
MPRLDFEQIKRNFEDANTLNQVRAYYKELTEGNELTEKQDTAIWGFFNKRRIDISVALNEIYNTHNLTAKEILAKYGDVEVIA